MGKTMKPKKAAWKETISSLVPAIETVVVFFIICLFNGNFASAKNIQSVLVSAAPMIVMASAYTFVILTGCETGAA